MIGPLVLTGFWFLIRRYSLQDGPSISLLELSHSFIQGLPGLIQQTGKILFPFNLSVMPTVQDTSLIFGILAIITLVIVFYKSKDKRIDYIAFGFCWFIFFLLPTFAVKASSPGNNFQHEHRLYVPMIGFFILFMETEIMRKLNFKNKGTLFICASIIIVLSLLGFNYSKRFKNTFNFWENAAANSPRSSAAQKGLGNAYFRAGKFDKAKAQFLKTIHLNPNETIAHNNLGLIYMNNNLLKEAEGEFKKEIAINPQFDKAYFNLGLVYSKQGNIQEAKTLWKKTLSINPDNFDASNNLARIYYREGRTKEAKNMWENILRVNPDYLNAYKNLVNYYYDQKDFPTAIYYVNELRKRAVEIPPDILKALGL
jgi:Flp pilus assembly protein TadD